MIEYRQAKQTDQNEIESLLNFYELPASDCAPHLDNFIVALESGELVGVGGYESCGDFGLLRSFAVSADHKGNGVAESIFNIVYEHAAKQGKTTLYLLTTTAVGYFKKMGFVECPRSECPDPIKSTKQFTELCPGSATTMFRAL